MWSSRFMVITSPTIQSKSTKRRSIWAISDERFGRIFIYNLPFNDGQLDRWRQREIILLIWISCISISRNKTRFKLCCNIILVPNLRDRKGPTHLWLSHPPRYQNHMNNEGCHPNVLWKFTRGSAMSTKNAVSKPDLHQRYQTFFLITQENNRLRHRLQRNI